MEVNVSVDICDIAAVAVSMVSLLITLLTVNRRHLNYIHEFHKELSNIEFIKARSQVYNLVNEGETADVRNMNIAIVVNFYNHWGMLVKKGYLPISAFEGGAVAGTLRMYELCKDYIQAMRDKHNDDSYGQNFEELYEKLNSLPKQQKKTI